MERKILVVTDDEGLKEDIEMILDKDYEVMFGENGNRIFEFFETPKERINLLIHDIKLPHIEGVEVLKKIREKQVEIPVIIITGYGCEELLKQIIPLGVMGYFDKPVNTLKLLEQVNRLLSPKREFLQKETIYQQSTKEKIELAKEIIDKNHNQLLSLKEISNKVYLEPKYFSRCFKEIIGENFYKYQTRKKVEKIKELLVNSDYTITQICYKVGYSQISCLTKMFKKFTHISPTEYRNRRGDLK